jgi:hypothetical protein
LNRASTNIQKRLQATGIRRQGNHFSPFNLDCLAPATSRLTP